MLEIKIALSPVLPNTFSVQPIFIAATPQAPLQEPVWIDNRL
jgi:hypothetical protein